MLLSKDENLKTSSVNVAYLILNLFKTQKSEKLSIFEITEQLKKYKIEHYRQMFCGLSLLYSVGLIDFAEPYFYLIGKS